jgi:polyphosphate kinase 2 (PPK2 family)
VWRARYAEIREFEAGLAAAGVRIVKCMLHISPEEQAERLLARLDDPQKRWKYNPGDLDARAKWPAYQEAYAAALQQCDSDVAPWYVVPSDHKWYRNWAVAAILAETLDEMAPVFPPPDYDVATERTRLLRLTNPGS